MTAKKKFWDIFSTQNSYVMVHAEELQLEGVIQLQRIMQIYFSYCNLEST